MHTITLHTKQRNEMQDITQSIQNILEQQKPGSGIVVIYVPHTTAAVTINEGADADVQHDILATLNQLIPQHNKYLHSEGNSDAHIKASILGASVTILFENNKLQLGTWQKIFFYEADGPRTRNIYLSIISATHK